MVFNVRTKAFTLTFPSFFIILVIMDLPWEWLRISIGNSSPFEKEKLTDALVRAESRLGREAVQPGWLLQSSRVFRCTGMSGEEGRE